MVGWLPAILLARPQQGAFRDYDVYACFALILSFAVFRLLLESLKLAPVLGRWAVLLSCLSTSQAGLGLLLVSTSPTATEARVRHGLELADRRLNLEMAQMQDFLGLLAEEEHGSTS